MYEFVSAISWICGIIGFLLGFFDVFNITDSENPNLWQRIIIGLLIGAFVRGISWTALRILLL